MGTWDSGAFDNDSAADWCGALHDMDPAERVGAVRRTFTAVADHDGEYLDSDLSCDAIAAAAVVASQLPGGTPLTTPYAPTFLIEGGTLEVPADIAPLALRALDRVAGPDSEWRELWEESPDGYRAALAEIAVIRGILKP
ncbi:DUF4259 domain-containing protein [Actinoplanes sp. NPDC051494]|uniref:DUF4259 domain-containing protein n=1 Tax=Actinoplanes sp. NPDC051494 TaxID=3363907 RepID=UPI0037BA16C8